MINPRDTPYCLNKDCMVLIKNGYCKNCKEKRRQGVENFNLLMAMEYGYKQAEKGNNIQMARSNFMEILTQ